MEAINISQLWNQLAGKLLTYLFRSISLLRIAGSIHVVTSHLLCEEILDYYLDIDSGMRTINIRRLNKVLSSKPLQGHHYRERHEDFPRE